jgi:hypothetical protein
MTGRGDYAVVTNSLITGNAGDIVPSFGSNTDSVVITNREYIRDIYCPLQLNSFQIVDSLALNPGLGESFPWLSQLAMNFEEYEFLQLAITFKSTIDQSLATNGQSGQVALTTTYNPDNDPFASKQEMMAYAGGMSCKTNQSMIHGVECDPAKNSGAAGKYIRPGALLASQGQLKDYDLGKTFVSVLDAPSQFLGVTLGELWVSYTVVLRKPKLAVNENYNVGRSVICSDNLDASNWPNIFGLEGDFEMQIATKATFPCEFRRPLSATTYLPATTASVFQDDMFWQVPTSFAGINTAMCVGIVFPPYYAGIVEVKCHQRIKSTASTPGFFQVTAQGQIFRYQDIPAENQDPTVFSATAAKFTHITSIMGQSQGTAVTQMDTMETTIHVRVMPSNNGVENILWWGTLQAQAPLCAYLEISGINTYLSLDDAPISFVKNRLPLEQYAFPGVQATYP